MLGTICRLGSLCYGDIRKQSSLYFKYARSYKTSREEKFRTESALNYEPVGLESAIRLFPVHGPGYRRAGARSLLGILIHLGAI